MAGVMLPLDWPRTLAVVKSVARRLLAYSAGIRGLGCGEESERLGEVERDDADGIRSCLPCPFAPLPGIRLEDTRRMGGSEVAVETRRSCPSLPIVMDWRMALPRAMQGIASTSCWTGLKASFHTAITCSMGGGGEGKPISSQ